MNWENPIDAYTVAWLKLFQAIADYIKETDRIDKEYIEKALTCLTPPKEEPEIKYEWPIMKS